MYLSAFYEVLTCKVFERSLGQSRELARCQGVIHENLVVSRKYTLEKKSSIVSLDCLC